MNLLKKWWFWLIIVIIVISIIFLSSLIFPVKCDKKCSQSSDCNGGEICSKNDLGYDIEPKDYCTYCTIKCNPDTNEPCKGSQTCRVSEVIEGENISLDYICSVVRELI
jgi:hypothetical protein